MIVGGVLPQHTDQRLSGQVGKACRPRHRQPVPGMRRQHIALLMHQPLCLPRRTDPQFVEQGGIQLPIAQRRRQIARQPAGKRNARLGMGGIEGRHRLAHKAIFARGLDKAEADLALLLQPQPLHPLPRIDHRRDDGQRLAIERQPRAGGRHPPPAAHQQRAAEQVLQILDSPRKGRLRNVEPARGGLDRAFLDRGDQYAQMLDLHGHKYAVSASFGQSKRYLPGVRDGAYMPISQDAA